MGAAAPSGGGLWHEVAPLTGALHHGARLTAHATVSPASGGVLGLKDRVPAHCRERGCCGLQLAATNPGHAVVLLVRDHMFSYPYAFQRLLHRIISGLQHRSCEITDKVTDKVTNKLSLQVGLRKLGSKLHN